MTLTSLLYKFICLPVQLFDAKESTVRWVLEAFCLWYISCLQSNRQNQFKRTWRYLALKSLSQTLLQIISRYKHRFNTKNFFFFFPCKSIMITNCFLYNWLNVSFCLWMVKKFPTVEEECTQTYNHEEGLAASLWSSICYLNNNRKIFRYSAIILN